MTYNRDRLSRVVAIANGKGGVGKTTVAASIGGLAAAAGYRVLLVDLDPQGNLGDDLGYLEQGRGDDGQALVNALLTGQSLTPVVPGVRENLDVISGGEALTDLGGALFARHHKGRAADSLELLAAALAPVAGDYDLVLIDTPPIDAQLQNLALAAARWLLIPTKADASSIRGLANIAERVETAHQVNPSLAVLGVILFDVPTSATRIRASAGENIEQILGGAAPLFETTVRNSTAVAREARDRGLLVHELAGRVEGAAPFWKALREGRAPERLPGSAPALADDFVRLVDAILTRISEHEQGSEVA
jgi:chromosome partitioning protein